MDIDPEAWRGHRNYLMAVAYRLLGSVTEAEDAVHEAYLRLRRHDGGEIQDVRRWLTTVVSRICLDELKSARVRRERYVGIWLPEPLVGPDAQPGPDDRLALKESVHIAILVMLETLTPPERIAFVLHDVFDLTFEEIALVLVRSATASRQLASRARTRVRRGVPRFDVSAAERERVVSAFLSASTEGNLESLVKVLDPTVVFRSDGGGVVPAARDEVYGPPAVARLIRGLAELYSDATLRLTPVNGGPGVVMERDGVVLGVAAITVAQGAVVAIDVVVNPAKLRHVDPR